MTTPFESARFSKGSGQVLAYCDLLLCLDGGVKFSAKGIKVVSADAGRVLVILPRIHARRPCRRCNRGVGYECRYCPNCGLAMPPDEHDSKAGFDCYHPIDRPGRSAFEQYVLTAYAAWCQGA